MKKKHGEALKGTFLKKKNSIDAPWFGCKKHPKKKTKKIYRKLKMRKRFNAAKITKEKKIEINFREKNSKEISFRQNLHKIIKKK